MRDDHEMRAIHSTLYPSCLGVGGGGRGAKARGISCLPIKVCHDAAFVKRGLAFLDSCTRTNSYQLKLKNSGWMRFKL
jgi:hypothetical protein